MCIVSFCCFARVAELVDALASGASGGNIVGVQVPPRAQIQSSGIGNDARAFFMHQCAHPLAANPRFSRKETPLSNRNSR